MADSPASPSGAQLFKGEVVDFVDERMRMPPLSIGIGLCDECRGAGPAQASPMADGPAEVDDWLETHRLSSTASLLLRESPSLFASHREIPALMEAQHPGTSTAAIVRRIVEFTPQVLRAYLRDDSMVVRQMGRAMSVYTVWLAARLGDERNAAGTTVASAFNSRREVVWTQSVALEPCDVQEMVRAEAAAQRYAEEREQEIQNAEMLSLLDRSFSHEPLDRAYSYGARYQELHARSREAESNGGRHGVSLPLLDSAYLPNVGHGGAQSEWTAWVPHHRAEVNGGGV
ncbi:hypothetical protein P7C70_g6057, partial [Phenoliferia sp. Uapishka_3]